MSFLSNLANSKISIHKVKIYILWGIFLTSSFDIFLNIPIAGFSFKFCFLLIIILFFVNTIFNRKIIVYITDFFSFIIWFFLIMLFIPNTTFIIRNVLYFFWLLLYLSLIISTINSINNIRCFYKTIKFYLYSFIVLSLIGLLQFFLGLMGINFLTVQWWIPDIFPRLNGFSYEPSYYSTYLMVGWGISYYLYYNRNNHSLFFILPVKLTFILTTFLIFLSTSRMGILFVIILIICLIFKELYNSKKKVQKSLIILFICVGPLSSLLKYDFESYSFLFQGLGIIESQASHSSEGRLDVMKETFQVFINNPIIGVSLGGIPSGIASIRGVAIKNQDEIKGGGGSENIMFKDKDINDKGFEGMNIFLEVLAASGFFGFIFFIKFLFSLIYKTFTIRSKDNNYNYLIKSLSFSLILVLVLLSLNQNILRIWVWVHIALLNLGFFLFKQKNSPLKIDNIT